MRRINRSDCEGDCGECYGSDDDEEDVKKCMFNTTKEKKDD